MIQLANINGNVPRKRGISVHICSHRGSQVPGNRVRGCLNGAPYLGGSGGRGPAGGRGPRLSGSMIVDRAYVDRFEAWGMGEEDTCKTGEVRGNSRLMCKYLFRISLKIVIGSHLSVKRAPSMGNWKKKGSTVDASDGGRPSRASANVDVGLSQLVRDEHKWGVVA